MYNSITETLLDKAGTTNTKPCQAVPYPARNPEIARYELLFRLVKHAYTLV